MAATNGYVGATGGRGATRDPEAMIQCRRCDAWSSKSAAARRLIVMDITIGTWNPPLLSAALFYYFIYFLPNSSNPSSCRTGLAVAG